MTRPTTVTMDSCAFARNTTTCTTQHAAHARDLAPARLTCVRAPLTVRNIRYCERVTTKVPLPRSPMLSGTHRRSTQVRKRCRCGSSLHLTTTSPDKHATSHARKQTKSAVLTQSSPLHCSANVQMSFWDTCSSSSPSRGAVGGSPSSATPHAASQLRLVRFRRNRADDQLSVLHNSCSHSVMIPSAETTSRRLRIQKCSRMALKCSDSPQVRPTRQHAERKELTDLRFAHCYILYIFTCFILHNTKHICELHISFLMSHPVSKKKKPFIPHVSFCMWRTTDDTYI